MRIILLLTLSFLIPATVYAHESKVTGAGMSEKFATAQAMRGSPRLLSVPLAVRRWDVGLIGALSPTAIRSVHSRYGYTKLVHELDMKHSLFALLVIASLTPSAMAQRRSRKLRSGQCPLGYVNLGTTVSPIYYWWHQRMVKPASRAGYRCWLQKENTRDFDQITECLSYRFRLLERCESDQL